MDAPLPLRASVRLFAPHFSLFRAVSQEVDRFDLGFALRRRPRRHGVSSPLAFVREVASASQRGVPLIIAESSEQAQVQRSVAWSSSLSLR
jgi:hypothetical protein